MRRIVIGPSAQTDARGIWRHTKGEHGPDAADAYLRDLDQAMRLVGEFPDIGSDCSDVRRGYRRIRSGSHLIYYIATEAEIYVVRILHERQDANANLAQP
jgi:toxin ParE1/3/4